MSLRNWSPRTVLAYIADREAAFGTELKRQQSRVQ
jgi:hypothetical protein